VIEDNIINHESYKLDKKYAGGGGSDLDGVCEIDVKGNKDKAGITKREKEHFAK
jgi:hypothetical protein